MEINSPSPPRELPLRHGYSLPVLPSLLIAVLMTAASAAGLLERGSLYPSAQLQRVFLPNDAVNLLIGLPALLVSVILARRGSLTGLLLWPGALMYVLYNSIAYLFGAPFSWIFVLYTILAAGSFYATLQLADGLDGPAIQQRLSGAVPSRFGGGVLAGLGLLFLLRAAGMIAPVLLHRTPLNTADLAASIADCFITPLWIVTGVLLWRERVWGYLAGPAMLYQGSLLFAALILFLLLQPVLTGAPFVPANVVVISILGLVCFIPFGWFLKGIRRK